MASSKLVAGLFGLLFVGHISPAQAYKVIGTGTDSCGKWTEDRRIKPGAAVQDEEWVLGFLSGLRFDSASGADPLAGLNAQAVIAWVDRYCQANPLRKIIEAAEALYAEHPKLPLMSQIHCCR